MPSLHSIAINNSAAPSGTVPPVLFLHGLGGVGAQWWGLQTAVSFKAPTFAFDLPGHGRSLNYPKAGPPKVAARAVLAELDNWGVETAHIVGHSMGGAIASLIALMAPHRVASLTLLAPGGYGPEVNIEVLRKWAAARQAGELRKVMPHFFAPTYDLPEKMVEFQVQLRQQPGLVDSLVAIVEGIGTGGVQGVLPIDDIVALDLPMTVIWGALDGIVPVSQAHQLRDRVDLHLLDHVGHSPLEEVPDYVRELVLTQVAKQVITTRA